MKNIGKKLLITILSILVILCAVCMIYLSVFYHAGDAAQTAMNGNEKVSVHKIDGGYLFDGPSDSKAIIFYPGAKVESTAYAPLLLKLSEEGFDCFLTDMPFNMPVFGINAADIFIFNYQYDTWIIAGHSLGGSIAVEYANSHQDIIDGIILLASYPSTKLDNHLKLCSVYGSKDGVLSLSRYESGKKYWPEQSGEVIIEGGNHAQFGDYGFQDRDNPADITAEEQQTCTVDIIAGYR